MNFELASITALMPIAPGSHIPDAFTDSGNGLGITWGLCHFRDVLKVGGSSQSYSILARFDCDLSLDVNDPLMKETDIFNDASINFIGLTEAQLKRIKEVLQE